MVGLLKSIDPFFGAALVLVLLGLGYAAVTGSFRFWRVAVGVDGRYSSSLFQGLCWTIVVLFSYVAMFIARVHVGSTAPLEVIPANVLTALGLSLGTTAAAAGITSSRVARRKEIRSRAGADQQGFAALVEDDAGRANLPKTQLLGFAFVTLAIYLVATADAVTRTLATTDLLKLPGLPDIDTTLLVLSGIGHGSYLVTKAVATPTSATAGTDPAASPAIAVRTAAVPSVVRAATTLPVSVRVPGFSPSVNGLHFTNAFPSEPDFKIDLPGIGTIQIGDASNGLCGGMAFTVRDVFQTAGLAPIADTEPPTPDRPLFHYLVERLIASFDVPGLGFLKYYEWMVTPDGDSGWPPLLARRGVAWKTIVEEWPSQIRPELDAGRLCCLGLVTTASPNPSELGRNHQVLAYGYELDSAQNLKLLICDPNTPQATADDVWISLSLADPEHPTTINHNVGIGTPIRGFFRVNYSYQDPTDRLA